MSLDMILKTLEDNPDIRPDQLSEEVSMLIRMTLTGEVVTPADFLVKVYVHHLKKLNKPLPKGPADYNMEFIDKATVFFDYAAHRCLYASLKKQGIVEFEDDDSPLLSSDMEKQTKVEITEKGKEFFKNLQEKIEEARKKQETAAK